MNSKISIVIPVYNNEQTIFEAYQRIVDTQLNSFPELSLEILFVNDGSKDQSWPELKRIQALSNGTVVLINLSRNFGQLGALFAGFNHARGDAVICLSADLQDPIELIAQMIALWRSGNEIVACYREDRRDGFFRHISSKMAYSIARVSQPDLPQGGFDYWLMSRRVCDMMCSFKGRHNFIQGYLMSLGFNKALIPYVRNERKFGSSGYSFMKKIKITIDFVVDSSYLPMRFMSMLGLVFSSLSLLYSGFIIYARFMYLTPFEGWAPLMIMIMLVGGIIMVMLGLIGEYIWRIYDNIKDFPLYIVSEYDDGINK